MSSFENLRIVDNFYQTSLFFPMPTVVISTLCEDGMTNCGPYFISIYSVICICLNCAFLLIEFLLCLFAHIGYYFLDYIQI